MGKTGQDRKIATRGKSLLVTVCTLLENILLFRKVCVFFHFGSIISTVTISLIVLNHRSRHLEMTQFHYVSVHVRGSDSAHPFYGVYCAPTVWQALIKVLGACREQGR